MRHGEEWLLTANKPHSNSSYRTARVRRKRPHSLLGAGWRPKFVQSLCFRASAGEDSDRKQAQLPRSRETAAQKFASSPADLMGGSSAELHSRYGHT